MTYEEFIEFIKFPDHLTVENIFDLKELVNRYPFFVPARMLYVKALQLSNSIHLEQNIKNAVVYCSDRKWLYDFLFSSRKESLKSSPRPERKNLTGSYFDLLEMTSDKQTISKQSLKELAEQLKAARSLIIEKSPSKEQKNQRPLNIETTKVNKEKNNFQEKVANEQNLSSYNQITTEEKVKKLVKGKNYEEAVKILKELNLNNPEKSIYFADQIRFLEKVIEYLKK
ncbi:MAG TPA: hypothetical protein PLE52_06230 [Paludibacteraceae bacterium]|nr:hypothetical protein [Paludibacteraceae bacterium]